MTLHGLRGELRLEEPLAGYTTWRTGGPAERLYRPADAMDLAAFLATLAVEEPVFWLGLGSNLLVRDGGLRGTVIATPGALAALLLMEDDRVRAEAGVACNKVARFAARHDLSGAEFLAGIPGTMGGALAMNAGAWGGDTWSLVAAVETVDRRGRRRLRGAEDFEVGYRSVQGPRHAGGEEWFLAARLRLTRGAQEAEAGRRRIKALLAQRAASQPTGVPSAGSVFRNPPGDHAARLIDACGLKGVCEGQACVSDKHANFIINTGGATARDIETLIQRVADTVEQRTGVRLVPEVRIVGEAQE
jgi:UDP-N-acetylmuramate dehydrogenase